jgi:hypothetical protein
MARAIYALRFFLDNNIPDSIGRYLQSRGHSVLRQRFTIPPNSPDPVVAMTAMQDGRILVTQDKDFNNQRFAQGRFTGLSRLSLSGPAPTLLTALKEYIHLIELQAQHLNAKKSARLIVFISLGQIRFRT